MIVKFSGNGGSDIGFRAVYAFLSKEKEVKSITTGNYSNIAKQIDFLLLFALQSERQTVCMCLLQIVEGMLIT